MSLTVDTREVQVIGCLDAMKPRVEYTVQALDVGDIQIACAEITVIFERKTVRDLVKSLKDNRYREQKMRLLNQRAQGDRIIFMIEGKTDMNDPSQLGCYVSMQIRDQILTIFTDGVQDTVTYILGVTDRLRTNPAKFSVPRPLTRDEYNDTCIRPRKKDNSSKESVFLNQLCAIPGISIKKAKIISEGTNCKCMNDLLAFMRTDDLSTKCHGIGEKLQLAVTEHLL